MATVIPQLSERLSGANPTSVSSETRAKQVPAVGGSAVSGKNISTQQAQTPASQSQDSANARLTRAEAEQLLEKMNLAVEQIQRGLSFTIDESQGEVIIKVIDRETNETIRQIPSEEMVRISRRLQEVNSLLFDDIRA